VYEGEKYQGFVNSSPSAENMGHTFILHCTRSPDLSSASAESPSFMTLGHILPQKHFSQVTANREQVAGVSPDFHHQCAVSNPKSHSKAMVLAHISTFRIIEW